MLLFHVVAARLSIEYSIPLRVRSPIRRCGAVFQDIAPASISDNARNWNPRGPAPAPAGAWHDDFSGLLT
jgi:hypothetical protein